MRIPIVALPLVCSLSVGAQAMPQADMLTASSPVGAFAHALARSTFAFTGVVTALRESTSRSVSPSSHTLVVLVRNNVDTIFRSPGGMRSLSGRSITLVVDRATDFVVGTPFLFFAYGVAVDNGIALRAVALLPATRIDRTTMSRLLAAALDSQVDSAVRDMVERSTAVFTGTVESILTVTPTDSMVRRAPWQGGLAWRQATVRIGRLYKAHDLSTDSVVKVMFLAAATRERPDAPVLAVGTSHLVGVRRFSSLTPSDRAGIASQGRYVVISSGDVRPSSDTVRVLRASR